MVKDPTNSNQGIDVLETPHGHHGGVIAEALGVEIETGLTDSEAAQRLSTSGTNTLDKDHGKPWWLILLGQFSSIVIWLLIAAAAVAWFTDSGPEAIAILVVLVLNALIGFAVEWRAGQALNALRDTTQTYARVRRGGKEMLVDAVTLVIGDIIGLAAGDRVPADARLLEAVNLQVDESALTGESFPVTKSTEPVSPTSILGERWSMLYLGTIVVSGRALAVVTATGSQTEIGRVGQLLAKTRNEATPLEKRLASLGRILVYIVLGIAVVVVVAGYLRGNDPALMFEVAISLAVAAIPEALPAMTTLILALGLLRMAKRHAIVRKLSAVETLGSTTVICTDKTGTLTQNRMTVQEYRLADKNSVTIDNAPLVGGLLERLLRVSILCNDASFDSASAAEKGAGDPTETALLAAAQTLRMDVAAERLKYEKFGEEPFDAASKRMITGLRSKQDDSTFFAAKGATAVVLDMCSHFIGDKGKQYPISDDARSQLVAINDEMAGRGLRVLAFADKENKLDEKAGYTFLGFSGMTDPPRPGVAEAIRAANTAGIRVVMLTGDQALTARTIATRLNLGNDADIFALHASEMAEADDAWLAEAAGRAHVFARVSPEDKLRIVDVLQRAGEVVAVTGDGINDAPALRKADIGIAMGMRGTEVAKEAADVVLTDDNFLTIIHAIEGGRTIYANIIKFVHLMFSKNLAEVLVIFAAIIAGLPLPLLPLQILWLNLVTDVFPAFALAVEPSSGSTMKQKPRPPGETLLSSRFLILIGWQGVILAAITLLAYLWALDVYGDGAHSRTMALMSIVAVQLGHTFNCRSRTQSAFVHFTSNPYIFVAAASMILLQVLAVCVTPLANILDLVRLNWNDIFVIMGCIVIPVFVVELTKILDRRRAASSR